MRDTNLATNDGFLISHPTAGTRFFYENEYYFDFHGCPLPNIQDIHCFKWFGKCVPSQNKNHEKDSYCAE